MSSFVSRRFKKKNCGSVYCATRWPLRTGAVNISAIYSPQMLPFVINALPTMLPSSQTLVFFQSCPLVFRGNMFLSACTLQSALICVWCPVSLVYWTRLTILPTFATIIWPFNVFFFHLPVFSVSQSLGKATHSESQSWTCRLAGCPGNSKGRTVVKCRKDGVRTEEGKWKM